MDQTESDENQPTPDLFRPSWGRGWAAAAVAIAAFFVSQEIPLEWYPLNDPSSGLRYLEIKCAANVTANTQILLNTGQWSEINKISWPIGPSEMTFTYTFPLADAPLRELRVDPLDKPGELLIENFRLINRRGEELRRFTKDDFRSLHNVTILPTENGWKMVVSGTGGGWAHIDFSHFTVAEDMNVRNLLRCLLSTSYLAMMLWILLLAVFFAFRAPEPWRKTAGSMAFLALLGALFAFVGNRGLIRNSIRYAWTEVPPVSNALMLQMDVNAPQPGMAQLFWDTGKGFNETESTQAFFENTPGLQTLRLPLPSREIRALRFDPIDHAGRLTIRRLRVTDGNGNVRAVLTPNSFRGEHEIAKIERMEGDGLAVAEKVVIETTPAAKDPILSVSDSVAQAINTLRKGGPRPDRGEWPPREVQPASGAQGGRP